MTERARLVLVSESPQGHNARLLIGDHDVSRFVQRVALEVDVHSLASAVITVTPRDGFMVDLPAETTVYVQALPGYDLIEEPRPDGGKRLRCEPRKQ